MSELPHTNTRRHTEERRQMDDRRNSEGRRENDACPLQNLHIEKFANLEARMDAGEAKSKNIENKLEVVTRIDSNLQVITELFKLQKETNAKQEKTNEKLEDAISKVADAVTESKLNGSISFNQIFNKLFLFLIGGGAIWFIYGVATGAIKIF
jgi:two-component sensor histidine kinase